MKKIVAVCVGLLLITSCQKGIFWDLASEGSLAQDASGNCLPITVAGNYNINIPANDSNYIIVTVNVTAQGNYTITSDSINGYSFKASGVFNSTGSFNVKLACTGTPLAKEDDHFSVFYNNSFCEVTVPVGDTTPGATYTLSGSPDTCMNDSIAGNYIETLALDASNAVFVSVDVAGAGAYSITTNSVNGYSFSASGTFTANGVQTVMLLGTGTPAVAEDDAFTVTAGTSTCSFTITVVPVVISSADSYFPLTQNSFWNYNDLVSTGNVIHRSIDGDTIIDNTTYEIMHETENSNTGTYYFTKNSNADYYEYATADKYTNAFEYEKEVYGMLPFLNDKLITGQTWESPEYSSTAALNQKIFIKYEYQCLDNNASVIANGQGFINVYIITVAPYIEAEGNPYYATGETYYYYYAKGIGLIYLKEINGAFKQPKMIIKDWQVN